MSLCQLSNDHYFVTKYLYLLIFHYYFSISFQTSAPPPSTEKQFQGGHRSIISNGKNWIKMVVENIYLFQVHNYLYKRKIKKLFQLIFHLIKYVNFFFFDFSAIPTYLYLF